MNVPYNISKSAAVIFINDNFMTLSQSSRACASHPQLRRSGVLVYTSEKPFVQLILNIIVLRLSRMQDKNGTFFCIKTHALHYRVKRRCVVRILIIKKHFQC